MKKDKWNTILSATFLLIKKSWPKKNRQKKTNERKTEGTKLKVLWTNQLIQGLPTLLVQIQAGRNKSLKNEIREVAYLLYRDKQIAKNSTKHLVYCANVKMKKVLMNSENNKTIT